LGWQWWPARSRFGAAAGDPEGKAPPFAQPSAQAKSGGDVAGLASQLKEAGPSFFRELWNAMPREFQAIAWECPQGIITDVESIATQDSRISMCKRINELRRERCRSLASPKAVSFYEEDNVKFVPMSRQTERHFWDLFHKLPIATTDATKWKAVLRFLEDCPEKAKGRTDTARCVEFSFQEPVPISPGKPLRSGLETLRSLAAASPVKPPVGLSAAAGADGGDSQLSHNGSIPGWMWTRQP
jgi:hypothetical protein